MLCCFAQSSKEQGLHLSSCAIVAVSSSLAIFSGNNCPTLTKFKPKSTLQMGQTLTNKKKTKVERSQELESREEYFISNGGILLEKYIALSQGQDIGVGQLKIFSIEDITKATCNYDPDAVVGRSNLSKLPGMRFARLHSLP